MNHNKIISALRMSFCKVKSYGIVLPKTKIGVFHMEESRKPTHSKGEEQQLCIFYFCACLGVIEWVCTCACFLCMCASDS